MIFTIIIPGIPVAKGRPRITSAGRYPRAYTPEKTRRYEDMIRCAACERMNGEAPLDEPVRVSVTAYIPPPKSMSAKRRRLAIDGAIKPTTRPDCDNYAKAALDGCNAVVFRDDSLVTDLCARKRYSERPRLVITIETEDEYA